MFGKSSVSLTGCLNSNFVSHVTSDGFYKKFANEVSTVSGLEYVTKDELKSIVFLIIYSSESIKYVQDEKVKLPIEAFRKCYPDVLALYDALKRGVRTQTREDFKFLPRMLQNIEAILFLERIVPRFMKEFPGIPIYTIHDCALVPESYKKELERIVVEETEKAIGYKPHYKMEDLTPEKLFAESNSTLNGVQFNAQNIMTNNSKSTRKEPVFYYTVEEIVTTTGSDNPIRNSEIFKNNYLSFARQKAMKYYNNRLTKFSNSKKYSLPFAISGKKEKELSKFSLTVYLVEQYSGDVNLQPNLDRLV